MIKLLYTVASQKFNNKIKRTWEDQTWLNYKNLLPNDVEYLKKNFNALVRTDNISLSTTEPNNPRNKKTENIINSLKYLESTGNYVMPKINDIMVELIASTKDIITPQDKTDIKQSTDALWIKFMKEIQKPEMQLLLKSIGQYSLKDTSLGWQLSANNLVRILAQKPDATFVQTRNQWFQKYQRRVLPNATKIGVMVPVNNKYENLSKNIDDLMRSVGYGPNVSYNDLSTQQKDYLTILNRSKNSQAKSFALKAYYDVSDTELINPNDVDKWADEVGFDNNLTAHLNKHAVDYMAKMGGKTPDDIVKIYNNEEGNIELLTKCLAKGIESNYPEVGISLPKTPNKNAYEKCYVDMISRLADKLIEDVGKIVKKENREEGVSIATTIVLCLTKVSPERVALKLKNNDLTEKSYFELRNIINDIIKIIRNNLPTMENKKHINEFTIPTLNSVDELLNMMGMTRDDVRKTEDSNEENIDNLKENFYNFYNRINNKK